MGQRGKQICSVRIAWYAAGKSNVGCRQTGGLQECHQERATWAADTLAVYRSVTRCVIRNWYRSRRVFRRYLLPGLRGLHTNYLGRPPLQMYISLTAT